MDYFLGVDGGATDTTSAVCDRDGRIVGIGRGGPSNHILAPGGEARARTAIETAVHQACASAGLAHVEFQAAQFGMTGINPNTEPARVLANVIARLLRARIVQIHNDAFVALAGALACRPGVVLIAGTGSVAFGQDPGGQEAKAGGWGYLFGDEGSAFALGLGGVRAALRARDGVGAQTSLVGEIPQRSGRSLGDLPLLFYEGHIPRSEIAALAPAVTAAAVAGDPIAGALVEEAAEGLAGLAAAVIARLSWPDGTVALAPVGGVFRAGPLILRPLKAALARRAPGAVLVPPRFPPAVGALLLALRAAEVQHTPERLALLAATWELRGGA